MGVIPFPQRAPHPNAEQQQQQTTQPHRPQHRLVPFAPHPVAKSGIYAPVLELVERHDVGFDVVQPLVLQHIVLGMVAP